jgi:hypothetical protein
MHGEGDGKRKGAIEPSDMGSRYKTCHPGRGNKILPTTIQHESGAAPRAQCWEFPDRLPRNRLGGTGLQLVGWRQVEIQVL